MCGIVAIIGGGYIKTTLNKIKHRGKDSLNIFQNKFIKIGFNRLAINDKSALGNQPFEYGNLVGVFNGEIFNADELKKTYNLNISSNSDTAVILPLFKTFGSKVIHHLDGFYSGIIYNKINNDIFLIKDYIGKKPLFYVKSESLEYIVSELKSLNIIDNFQIIPKGFSKLDRESIKLLEAHKSDSLPKNQLRITLCEAVKKRIPRDEEKFGVFLSGGLDSSIIASIVSKEATNVIYYTLGSGDDYRSVELLAKQCRIANQLKIIELPHENEIPNLIEKIVYHTESYNPSIISNGLATYLLSEAAHNDGLKVVLTGEGADELFCGYNIDNCFDKRQEFIENMHFTECRRLDLASMAHTIEARCPFLDKSVFAISEDCSAHDLIKDGQEKHILRKAFEKDLPYEISNRQKMSFDVGSGIRKLVVEYLTRNGKTEKVELKKIWSKLFTTTRCKDEYFHSYPSFDKIIGKRGTSHNNNRLMNKIETLLLEEFRTVPFHNIFMLNNLQIVGSSLGGTCSDKVLHFKKVLKKNGIESKLHSAFINDKECHRMLVVEINEKKYFIDPGSGWINPKLYPDFKNVEYDLFGMSYKTELTTKNLFLYHKSSNDYKLTVRIPLKSKPENDILLDIENRYQNKDQYPFKNNFRFTKLIDDAFYFIKGDQLRVYRDSGVKEEILEREEIKNLIQNKFNFNLKPYKNWFPTK